MKCTISEDAQTLTITASEDDLRDLRELKENDPFFQSDSTLHDFFERLTCNSAFEWVDADETGDLTSAPMLGIRDTPDDDQDSGSLLFRWAYMDYALRSPLDDLLEHGKVILTGGCLYTLDEHVESFLVDCRG